MCNAGPRHAEDTGIADEGPVRELGQLPIETGRQITLDLADLLFDQMVVVQQPLGCWGDAAAFAHRGSDGAIGSEQHRFVFAQALVEGSACRRSLRDCLRLSQACGVFFESVDAEQLLPDDRIGIPR